MNPSIKEIHVLTKFNINKMSVSKDIIMIIYLSNLLIVNWLKIKKVLVFL